MSGAGAIAQVLAEMGARRCFGVLGTANFKITDALCGAGVQYIPARHEGNAASMGDAYARLSDELVLVSVHSGPGLSNAITGIGEAAKSRTPLLILAGDVATGDLRSNFYIEQAEMVRAVGATFERTHSPKTALRDATRAARAVVQDRRTVVLSLPVDVQDADLPIALHLAGPRSQGNCSSGRGAIALEASSHPGRSRSCRRQGEAIARLPC